MDRNRISEILTTGNFEEFIGHSENEWFECKQAPYSLDTARNKRELAKDIASLANASGGFIVLGIKTKKSDTHHGDEVKEIRPYQQSFIDFNDYHKVLKDWIYPNPDNIEMKWYPSRSEPEKGVIAISVPQQPSSLAPFLLAKTIDEDDRLAEIVFGYCERKRANIEPTSAPRLHTIIKDGLRFDSIVGRIDALEKTVQEIARSGYSAREQSLDEKRKTMSTRIQEGVLEGKFLGRPYFALSIAPERMIDMTSIFEGRGSEVVMLLDGPPSLRWDSFNLAVDKPSDVLRGQLRRSLDPGYKLLELWRDGNLIFIGDGDMDLLSWGTYRSADETLRINDYALIEMTYLFCDLGGRILSTVTPRPESFLARIELHNMSRGAKPCTILSTQKIPRRIRTAPADGQDFEFEMGPDFFDTAIAAFRFVSRIYEWFGVDYDKIPLTRKRANGTFYVDREQISNL